MATRKRQPRYIEVSQRNPQTRILVGSGTACCHSPVYGDVCIEIERAVSHEYKGFHKHKTQYNSCCQPECKPLCDKIAAHVCALEVDEEGYAVFEWPPELFNLEEGWYTGRILNGCSECGELPLRIGPRCNVIEVEHIVAGPDDKCWVGCPDECPDVVCPTASKKHGNNIYTPDYEIN